MSPSAHSNKKLIYYEILSSPKIIICLTNADGCCAWMNLVGEKEKFCFGWKLGDIILFVNTILFPLSIILENKIHSLIIRANSPSIKAVKIILKCCRQNMWLHCGGQLHFRCRLIFGSLKDKPLGQTCPTELSLNFFFFKMLITEMPT